MSEDKDIPGTPTEIPLSDAWRINNDVNSQLQVPGFRLIPPPFNLNDNHPEPPSSGKLTQLTQSTQATQSQQDVNKMSAQKDMQDLLRLLTTGRNKMPMLAAMGRVKALQSANLRRSVHPFPPPPPSFSTSTSAFSCILYCVRALADR